MPPRKRFAQHWLRSDAVLDKIVAAAQLSPGDRVLEIGPGQGVLTRQLFPLVESLVAVELDRDLCKKLVKKFADIDNFLLLQGDFLSLNLAEVLTQSPDIFKQQNKVVANIPYNITAPILEKLLGDVDAPNPNPYESIVLLLQKEVGDRLCAKPGSKTFGALSVRVQYLADCESICHVPPKAFYPPPKVDSVVVRLTPRSIPVPAENPKKMATLIKLGFSSRRKMLRNNLKGQVEADTLHAILEQRNLPPESRAERLAVEDWVALANSLTP
ncbi:16S rRNA (adenine(1518)-N(6)/adenine(1519)-N(6))-dimethyltransferase RsmA [Phormidium yuhuli AB48]|uniref:Ribosomal RNA small subunit methyltransferase A n=1 Tax=Phormidium yuhuli AB48 TaxID=2940671 RepID=A0ABY5ASL0_9CYAN|nr:16S rRNA (adenine(1518)-N(6)/adenine(1519)-N(6))-dimethyltransferase RsmA [Phormidium yuhuli]USR92222.1 16S rRNA (adenine(1518)-N(6)/adenine(1519)-N(6))-dimethyltransferase RsmA [Phormidium yuhuli AB48]